MLTAAVLAYKRPLHGLVEKLGWDDVFAVLRLLIATFIALPLLPNRPIDPWGKFYLLGQNVNGGPLVDKRFFRKPWASQFRTKRRCCWLPCSS